MLHAQLHKGVKGIRVDQHANQQCVTCARALVASFERLGANMRRLASLPGSSQRTRVDP